jgi:hypothetical protein
LHRRSMEDKGLHRPAWFVKYALVVGTRTAPPFSCSSVLLLFYEAAGPRQVRRRVEMWESGLWISTFPYAPLSFGPDVVSSAAPREASAVSLLFALSIGEVHRRAK